MERRLGSHNCDQCKSSGSCSIETVARHFSEHPEDEDEFLELKDKIAASEWPDVLVSDTILSIGDSVNEGLVTSKVVFVSLMTGFVLGKGAEFIPQKINQMEDFVATMLAKSGIDQMAKEHLRKKMEDAPEV